ncbi:hypothetical protein [Pseudomonas azerbaijanoccidentalis]
MNFIYQDPSISHDEAVRFLDSDLETDIVTALISIGLNEQDNVWAQIVCLKHLENGTESVAASAVTALGHIARRHGKLDKEVVLPALETVKQKYPSLEGIIADTLDDMDVFT